MMFSCFVSFDAQVFAPVTPRRPGASGRFSIRSAIRIKIKVSLPGVANKEKVPGVVDTGAVLVARKKLPNDPEVRRWAGLP
jgi:hypothetical protein